MLDDLKKPCAFLIKLGAPLETNKEILAFLTSRNISVNTMHLQCLNEKEGILIIHCLLEKDRIRYTIQKLEKIKGIHELEILESKGTHLLKGEK